MTKNLKAKHSLISTGQVWRERGQEETWMVYSLSENGSVRLFGPNGGHRFKSLPDDALLDEWELVG